MAAAEVIDVLRDLNADVIALQGVSDSVSAAELAEALPGSWRVACWVCWPGPGWKR